MIFISGKFAGREGAETLYRLTVILHWESNISRNSITNNIKIRNRRFIPTLLKKDLKE
jgi:hypothetical protein